MTLSWPLFWLIIGVLLLVAVLVQFLPTQRSRSKAGSSADRHLPGSVFRDDDRYWVGGFLYNNPDDPDLFVPKRYGLGWTMNIGQPRGKLMMIGMLLLPLVLIILKALSQQ